jgi:predicted Zn-dependent protease
MKTSPFKSLINYLIIVALLVYIGKQLKQNKKQVIEPIYISQDVIDPDVVVNENTEPEVGESDDEYIEYRNTLYLHGLGDYDESVFDVIKRGIESFYKLRVIIGEPLDITNFDVTSDGYDGINGNKVLNVGREHYSENKHMFITNNLLYHNIDNTNQISGLAHRDGDMSIITSYQLIEHQKYSDEYLVRTALHELGHNFGVKHCETQDCIMSPFGPYSKTYLCDDCTNQLNNELIQNYN